MKGKRQVKSKQRQSTVEERWKKGMRDNVKGKESRGRRQDTNRRMKMRYKGDNNR